MPVKQIGSLLNSGINERDQEPGRKNRRETTGIQTVLKSFMKVYCEVRSIPVLTKQSSPP